MEPLRRGLRMILQPPIIDAGVGELFEVEILVDAADAVAHLPMTLAFDPSVIEFESLRAGDFLGVEGDAEVVVNSTAPGIVVVGASRLRSSEGVSGSGSVATMVFRAKKPGETELSLARVEALGAGLQPIAPLETWQALAVVHSSGEGSLSRGSAGVEAERSHSASQER